MPISLNTYLRDLCERYPKPRATLVTTKSRICKAAGVPPRESGSVIPYLGGWGLLSEVDESRKDPVLTINLRAVRNYISKLPPANVPDYGQGPAAVPSRTPVPVDRRERPAETYAPPSPAPPEPPEQPRLVLDLRKITHPESPAVGPERPERKVLDTGPRFGPDGRLNIDRPPAAENTQPPQAPMFGPDGRLSYPTPTGRPPVQQTERPAPLSPSELVERWDTSRRATRRKPPKEPYWGTQTVIEHKMEGE